MSFFDMEASSSNPLPLDGGSSSSGGGLASPSEGECGSPPSNLSGNTIPTLEDRLTNSTDVIAGLEAEVLQLDGCDTTATRCCPAPISMHPGRTPLGIEKEELIYKEMWNHLDDGEFQSELLLGGGGGGMFGPSPAMSFLCQHFHYLMRMSCSLQPVFPGIRLPLVREKADDDDKTLPLGASSPRTISQKRRSSPMFDLRAEVASPLPPPFPSLEEVLEVSHAAAVKVLQGQQSSEWVAQLVRKLDNHHHEQKHVAARELVSGKKKAKDKSETVKDSSTREEDDEVASASRSSPTKKKDAESPSPADTGLTSTTTTPLKVHVDPYSSLTAVSTMTPECSTSSSPPSSSPSPSPQATPTATRESEFSSTETKREEKFPHLAADVALMSPDLLDWDHQYDARLDEIQDNKTISLRALQSKNEHSLFAATLSAVCDSDDGTATLLEQAIGLLIISLKPCPGQRSELTACFETLMTKHKLVASSKFPTSFRKCLERLHSDPTSSRWILVGFVEELYGTCGATAPPPALKGKNLAMCCSKLFGDNGGGGDSLISPSNNNSKKGQGEGGGPGEGGMNISSANNSQTVSPGSNNSTSDGSGGDGFWSNHHHHCEYSVLSRMMTLLFSGEEELRGGRLGEVVLNLEEPEGRGANPPPTGEETPTPTTSIIVSEDAAAKLDALGKAQGQFCRLLLEYSKPCRHWETVVRGEEYPRELKRRFREHDDSGAAANTASGGCGMGEEDDPSAGDNDPRSVMMQQQQRRQLNFPLESLEEVLYSCGCPSELPDLSFIAPDSASTVVFPWIKKQLLSRGAGETAGAEPKPQLRQPVGRIVAALELLRSLCAWALGELALRSRGSSAPGYHHVSRTETLHKDIASCMALVPKCLKATLQPPYNGAGLTVITQAIVNLVETVEPATLLLPAVDTEAPATMATEAPATMATEASSAHQSKNTSFTLLSVSSAWWVALNLEAGIITLLSSPDGNNKTSGVAATCTAFSAVLQTILTRKKRTMWVIDGAREQVLGPKTTTKTGIGLRGLAGSSMSHSTFVMDTPSHSSQSTNHKEGFASIEEVETITAAAETTTTATGCDGVGVATTTVLTGLTGFSASRVTLCFREDLHASSQLSFDSGDGGSSTCGGAFGDFAHGNNAPNVHPVPWATFDSSGRSGNNSPIPLFKGIRSRPTSPDVVAFTFSPAKSSGDGGAATAAGGGGGLSSKTTPPKGGGTPAVFDLFLSTSSNNITAHNTVTKTGGSTSSGKKGVTTGGGSSRSSSTRSSSSSSSASSIDLFAPSPPPPSSPFPSSDAMAAGNSIDLFAAYGM